MNNGVNKNKKSGRNGSTILHPNFPSNRNNTNNVL